MNRTVDAKRAAPVALLLASVFFLGLTGCGLAVQAPDASLSLDVNRLFGTMAHSDAKETHVRAYFYATYSGGEALDVVRELPLPSGGRVEFERVPAGQWRILLTVGAPGDGDRFVVSRYVDVHVLVIGGETNSVIVDRNDITVNPFRSIGALSGASVVSVLQGAADEMYAGTTNKLYRWESDGGDLAGGTFKDLHTLPPQYRIHSLSNGRFFSDGNVLHQGLFLSTSGGIVTYAPTTDLLNTSFSQALTNEDGTRKEVLDAGSYSGEDTGDILVFYQAENELGAASIGDDEFDMYRWVGVSLDEYAGLLQGRFILDLFITDQHAYFLTALGAFRLAADDLVSKAEITVDDLYENAVFFGEESEGPGLIRSMAVNKGRTRVLLGAANGVWTGFLTENDAEAAMSGVRRLRGTEGVNVTLVSLSPDDSYTAFVSASELYVAALGTDLTILDMQRFPFVDEQIGTLVDVAWLVDSDSSPILFVAGTAGAAVAACGDL